MEAKEIKVRMDDLLQNSGLNVRSRETGEANAGPGGLRLYEEALVGVAAADDPLFRRFREPGVVGPTTSCQRTGCPEPGALCRFFWPIPRRCGCPTAQIRPCRARSGSSAASRASSSSRIFSVKP
ncbi:hypothetical protein [Eubacterium callanderi]|uniref:Uncharacterized protein n=1 Tax=Eubacterium callanderi TaxID=53442 RepID=A0A853JKF6_9FIRM|nr:hypothetical protein [Eubacterium callanderi]